MIAEFFLKKYREKYGKLQLRLTREAIDKLCNYRWPGNVRELKHSIEKAVILTESNVVTPNDFSLSHIPNLKSKHSLPNLMNTKRKHLKKCLQYTETI